LLAGVLNAPRPEAGGAQFDPSRAHYFLKSTWNLHATVLHCTVRLRLGAFFLLFTHVWAPFFFAFTFGSLEAWRSVGLLATTTFGLLACLFKRHHCCCSCTEPPFLALSSTVQHMAHLFAGFDLNEPVLEDDNGNASLISFLFHRI
jgi:hypothetical protein